MMKRWLERGSFAALGAIICLVSLFFVGGVSSDEPLEATLAPYAAVTQASAVAPTPEITPTPEPTQSPAVGYVAGASVNLRVAASTGSQIMGSYPYGTALEIRRESGDWYYVKIDGEYGYMATRYVGEGTAPRTQAPRTYAAVSAPVITAAATAAPANDPVVYITNTGEKYHRGTCRYLSRSKIQTTLSSAVARGYTPCKVCRP